MASILPRVLFIRDFDRANEQVPIVNELWVTSVDSNTTYESLIRFLIQKQFLTQIEPSLRYNLFFKAVAGIFDRMLLPGSSREWYGGTLKEGQTIDTMIHSVTFMDGSKYPITHYECNISLCTKTSAQSTANTSSTSPDLGKIFSDFLTSQAVNAINFTASVVTITTALIVIEKWWSKKHSTESASNQERSSKSEIVAIRLLMTDGTKQRREEWLTNPERLKHYIDVFSQPSGSARPLQAIFVWKNRDPSIIDVSQGSQNNIQLDELLSYLEIDSEEKRIHNLTENTLPLDDNNNARSE